jgi:hypothetical protein
VLAEITRRASGAVDVAFRARRRTVRFAAPIKDGRIRVARRLRGDQRAGSGIVSLRWRGDTRVRSAHVRLRAADQPARLRIGAVAIRAGRLVARGSVSRRARGVVRLRLAYLDTGVVRTARFGARIGRGRSGLSAVLPRAARAGGYLTVQFTGYARARGGPMRGEQDARQVGVG